MLIPNGWSREAQLHWLAGKKQPAIDSVLHEINKCGPKKPVELVLQLAYYINLCGDSASAARFLLISKKDYPTNENLLQNLAVCLTKTGRFQEAIDTWKEFLDLNSNSYLAYDGLSHCFSRSGRYDEASSAGSQSLRLKDAGHGILNSTWELPNISAEQFSSAASKKSVIAFSLWGNTPRYLRGAIDNALAGPEIYPNWVLRFYVDQTVPSDIIGALTSLGSEVVVEPPGQSNRQRLCWRFKVADDKKVGRFLVRDTDSVIGHRERAAVNEWISSGRWFHVMRDWWTHTDLILAGMWGGIAGVLPNLARMLRRYEPSTMETPNVDQWFLRDKVWAYVRQNCCIHDRCFNSFGAQPWPLEAPKGDFHVGQDVFAAQREEQEKRLGEWMVKLPSLALNP